jgi:Ca2+-binding RTX toxin-like protein
VERDAAGRDAGGTDTIRFVDSGDGVKPNNFAQRGNVVQIELDSNRYSVGDTILVQFLNGPTQSNAYTISRVTPGTNPNTSVVEFTVANSLTLNGTALVGDNGIEAVGDWVDGNTLAVFASGDVAHEAMNRVSNGAPAIQSYDAKTGAVVSDLPVQALIDRNAMEFFDFGSGNPEQSGFVVPISFNVGRSNSVELILSGGPGNAVLSGGEGTDLIIDTAYDDILIGGNGNDALSSQIGFDIVDGGAGNDTIAFRSDKQVLIGGHGADHFVITGLGAGQALIADFKPWEDDKLDFSPDWLQNFMGGESRQTGPDAFSNLRFSWASDPLSSQFFTIQAHFGFQTGETMSHTTMDLVRIQYNSDLDRAWEQPRMAMEQLIASANRASEENYPDWTVSNQGQMT